MALDLVFADDYIVVVNKPANVLSVTSGSLNFDVRKLWISSVLSTVKDGARSGLIKKRGESVRMVTRSAHLRKKLTTKMIHNVSIMNWLYIYGRFGDIIFVTICLNARSFLGIKRSFVGFAPKVFV